MATSVFIVEDSAPVRASLEKVVARSGAFACVGACATGEEALRSIPQVRPEVVIMDIELPELSGIECTARLKHAIPELQILILTVYKNAEKIFCALQAGASGYLLKRSDPGEIVAALHEVKNGGSPMSSEIARMVVQSFHRPMSALSEPGTLTKREEEILRYLAQGFASKEIAAALTISYETVCGHLKNIYHKLHVRSRTEAVLKYLEKGYSS